ncbi:MAG TPA: hypothetical protein VFI82_13640 [Terriglobales bacterium]|nr:hypothetical protein [Terriglobales bacterium]
MAAVGQLALDFNSAPRLRDVRYAELAGFVDRVRRAGLARLRQLKGLVDQAITQETLLITDEDVPL